MCENDISTIIPEYYSRATPLVINISEIFKFKYFKKMYLYFMAIMKFTIMKVFIMKILIKYY